MLDDATGTMMEQAATTLDPEATLIQQGSRLSRPADRLAAGVLPRGADPARTGGVAVSGHRRHRRRSAGHGHVAAGAGAGAAARRLKDVLRRGRRDVLVDCEHVRAWLSPYLDDEVPASERARIDAHLLDCTACRQALDDLSVIAGSIRRATRYSAPAGLAARITAALPTPVRDRRSRRAFRGSPCDPGRPLPPRCC